MARAVLQAREVQFHHPRIFGDGAVNRGQAGGGGAVERDIDLRLQSEHGGVGRVAKADGRPVGLGKAELNFFPGERVPCLLVKEQVRGGEVDRILQFPGRCLVGMNDAFRVGLQIHLDLAFADYVAGLRIVFKIRAVDLVEAAGIAPVQA